MIWFIGTMMLVCWVVIMVLFSLLARKPDTLGVREGRLAPCPGSPNCVCSDHTDTDHGIAPLTFTDPPETARARLKEVLDRQPRCRIVTDEPEYLHAEFTSLLFRFVDDVEFRFDPAAGVIHLRSASRAGRSDLGVNRARMEAIRQAFGR